MIIETRRLILREYTMEDFDALYEILSDPETMQHYPAPYAPEKTRHWIEWNLENYRKFGFGLWAVVRKETGEFIGDCGLTLQTSMAGCSRKSAITSTKNTGGRATARRPPGLPGIGLLRTPSTMCSIPT